MDKGQDEREWNGMKWGSFSCWVTGFRVEHPPRLSPGIINSSGLKVSWNQRISSSTWTQQQRISRWGIEQGVYVEFPVSTTGAPLEAELTNPKYSIVQESSIPSALALAQPQGPGPGVSLGKFLSSSLFIESCFYQSHFPAWLQFGSISSFERSITKMFHLPCYSGKKNQIPGLVAKPRSLHSSPGSSQCSWEAQGAPYQGQGLRTFLRLWWGLGSLEDSPPQESCATVLIVCWIAQNPPVQLSSGCCSALFSSCCFN